MGAIPILKNMPYRHLRSPGSWFLYFSLTLVTLTYFLPFLDARNYFIGDDFVWLFQAQFGRFVPTLGPDDYSYEQRYGTWAFIYHLIPVAVYNDRPVGFLFIKTLYETFGMHSAGYYYAAILILHIVNVSLFYKYARIYLSTWSSWVAAALSATWYYSIEATVRINAVFDVLALTFSLMSVLLFRSAIDAHDRKKYIFAILFFIFAVRTKEYALGVVPILFLQESIFFGAGLKNTIKKLSGYIIVSALVLFRYFQLYFDKSSDKFVGAASDYRMSYDLRSLLENLYWYLSQAFYKPFISPIFLGLVFLMFCMIYIAGDLKLRRIYLYSIFSFAFLLGPVLLFAEQRGILYLYAPHFFIAFILAASLEGKTLNKALGVILILFVSVIPFTSGWKKQSTEWLLARRGEVHLQLKSGLPLIRDRWIATSGNLVIFVSGVKPNINAFVNPWAVRSYLHLPTNNLSKTDLYVLGQHTTKTEKEFFEKFCGQLTGKLFIEYVNDVAYDRTQDHAKNCTTSPSTTDVPPLSVAG